jgi:hypothetical protein
VQRLADDPVGGVRALEVAGVDVIDAVRHGLAQYRECGIAILRGGPNTPDPASCIAP